MSDGTYDDHRQRQLAAARVSFTEWLNRLPAKQRVLVKCIGAPEDDAEMANGRAKDVADLPIASYRPDIASLVDTLADEIAEKFKIQPDIVTLLANWMVFEIERQALSFRSNDINKIIGVFIDCQNPKLFSAGLAFAADLAALNGLGTQAAYARSIKLSRAAVSKTTKMWQRLLNLRPSSHMKSEEACQSYSRKATTDHWRKHKTGQKKAAMDELNKRFTLPKEQQNGASSN